MTDPVTQGIAIAGGGALASRILGGGGGGSAPVARPATSQEIQSQISQLPSIDVPSIFPSVGLSTPNYNFSGSGGQFSLNRTNPSIALKTFDKRIPKFFGAIDDLRSRFRPGFSEVRDARLGATTAARQRGLSNLRDSLARRRVQGSSFARAEEIQGEREFAQLEAEQQAQSFMEEVAVNAQLLEIETQAFQQLTNRALVDIEELRAAAGLTGTFTQAGIAQAGLSVQAQTAQLDAVSGVIRSLNGLSGTNAQLQTELDIANAQGLGNFLGTVTEALINRPKQEEVKTLRTTPTTTGNIYFPSGFG